MIKLTELDNGSLRISLEKGHKRELRKLIKVLGYWCVWSELFELSNLTGNGWGIVSGDDLGQLTDAPFILSGFLPPEESEDVFDMTKWTYEKGWWFPNYQVENEIETLLIKGFVDFIAISS